MQFRTFCNPCLVSKLWIPLHHSNKVTSLCCSQKSRNYSSKWQRAQHTNPPPPSLWQQLVGLSSQRALVSSRSHIWVDCPPQRPPRPRAAGGSEGVILRAVLHHSAAAQSPRRFYPAAPPGVSRLRRRAVLWSRIFKKVLTDRWGGRRPHAGPLSAPPAAVNWIHFRLSTVQCTISPLSLPVFFSWCKSKCQMLILFLPSPSAQHYICGFWDF